MSIAKFINWPMEVAGQAFKILGKIGRYLIDGAKSLGTVIKDAAAGALKVVGEAVGRIGEKLVSFVERILGRFGKLFGKEAASVGEHGLERGLAKEGGALAEKETGSALEKELEPFAGTKEAREARVEKSGSVENADLLPTDAEAQLEHIADHPELMQGTPPNRRAQVGDHQWFEQPNGNWCRHSNLPERCVIVSDDLKKALKS